MNKILHSHKEISPKELNESKKILKAFSNQFWKKQNKLNNPLMRKEDYLEVFKTATEILARIRIALHLNYTLTGNATNYLLQLAEHPQPNEQFMRTIVHEALKDSKGYILKCNKENIDSFIDEHLSFVSKMKEKRAQDKKNKVNKLKESWDEAINNMGEILKGKDNIQESYSELFLEDTSTNEPFIIEIAERLELLNESLTRFKKFQNKRKLKREKKEKLKKLKTSNDNSPNESPKVEHQTSDQESQSDKENQTTENKPTESNSNENNSPTETIEENIQPEENPNQKEIDERIMIQVQKVGESVEDIQEKIQNLVKNTDLHKLEEIKELSLQEKKEKIKSLRKTTVTLAEKLSQHLFSLDQLVGSSEKVRPFKKKQVTSIQSILSQVDQISEKLKHLESELKVQEEQERQKEEQERLKREIEERKKQEQLELQMKEKREKELKEMKVLEEKHRQEKERLERERLERERIERERREKEKNENFGSHLVHHQPNVKKLSPTSNEREILVNQRNEENANKVGKLPLPTKEHWRKLKYDAEFEVKKLANKYHLQSYVPNLNISELKIVEKDNLLTISGTRYPTEQEEKLLVQKLLNWLKHYSSSIQDWTESDFTRAILKVGSGSFGTFNVSYSLPDDYDSSKNISASYNRGVLEIEVPIVEKKKYVHPFFANNFGGFDNFW